MREEAQGEAEEVIQDAQRRAYRIVTEAEDIASSRREGANQYASEVMFSLEEQLSEILGQIRRGIDTLRPESDMRRPAGNDNMHVGV
jgi:vacuolar-type H+-ATPase subunit H